MYTYPKDTDNCDNYWIPCEFDSQPTDYSTIYTWGFICPHCGNTINWWSPFCPQCGKPLYEKPTQEETLEEIKKLLEEIQEKINSLK